MSSFAFRKDLLGWKLGPEFPKSVYLQVPFTNQVSIHRTLFYVVLTLGRLSYPSSLSEFCRSLTLIDCVLYFIDRICKFLYSLRFYLFFKFSKPELSLFFLVYLEGFYFLLIV